MVSSLLPAGAGPVAVQLREVLLSSAFLGRDVAVSVLLPPGHATAPAGCPVLYLNDGQDLPRLHLQATVEALLARRAVRPFVVVAPHANEHRTQEYGVAAQADYNGRGSRAGAYTDFVVRELLPYAQQHYRVSADPALAVAAGFSLGGLSAFDLVWQHPAVFARAGVFSGSFWWRSRAVGAGYTPADRIMLAQVRAGQLHPTHRFWLQTGTLDERNDRNENGVIDSLEDTLDLIELLVGQGLDPQHALRYVQVEGGHHHPDTWGRVMPDFLQWAFGLEARQLPAPLPVVRLQLDPHLAPEILPAGAAALPEAPPPPLVLPAAPGPLPAPISLMPMETPRPDRPAADEYQPFFGAYVALVPETSDPRQQLRTQARELAEALAPLADAQALFTYAPGKWTVKQVLLHLIDTERVFAYRALRFARADPQPLPAFDQDVYADTGEANARSMNSLLAEHTAVRAATLALFEGFGEHQLARAGTANNGTVSVRALLYIMAGHERHHLTVLRERYLPLL